LPNHRLPLVSLSAMALAPQASKRQMAAESRVASRPESVWLSAPESVWLSALPWALGLASPPV
jgi:hypothetical protein